MRVFKRIYTSKGKHKMIQLTCLIPLKSRGFGFSMKKYLKGQIFMLTTD